jgi:peptide deformylase
MRAGTPALRRHTRGHPCHHFSGNDPHRYRREKLPRNHAFALQALTLQLAVTADRFGPLARPLFAGLFVMSPELHLAEDAFTLHLLFQGLEGLIDVVVANDDLQRLLRLPWVSVRGREIPEAPRPVHPGTPFDRERPSSHIEGMAILKIARMGHPVLARRADPVADPAAPEIRRLVGDMVETMIDANGAGLAAPQVHVPLRVLVFQAPDERSDPDLSGDERFDHTAPLTILINPEIEIVEPAMEGGWEGCLSVPGLRGYVERPFHIRYRGFDTEGRVVARSAKGFHARVVQHECDHLDGILYPKRMTDLSKLIFESEARHWVPQEEA